MTVPIQKTDITLIAYVPCLINNPSHKGLLDKLAEAYREFGGTFGIYKTNKPTLVSEHRTIEPNFDMLVYSGESKLTETDILRISELVDFWGDGYYYGKGLRVSDD